MGRGRGEPRLNLNILLTLPAKNPAYSEDKDGERNFQQGETDGSS